MTTFEDGPAKDKFLSLKRAPVFLRVTVDGKTIDALDQLDDTPKESEKLFAYVRVGGVGRAFVDGVDPVTKRRKGWMEETATYRLFDVQPADEVMRDQAKWTEWCNANKVRGLEIAGVQP